MFVFSYPVLCTYSNKTEQNNSRLNAARPQFIMLFENVKTISDRTVTERDYFKMQFCVLGWLGQLESKY